MANFYHLSATGSNKLADPQTSITLVAINVNTGAASAVLTIYNGVDSTGQVVATVDASAKGSYWYGGVRCPAGLFAALTGGNADITVSFG